MNDPNYTDWIVAVAAIIGVIAGWYQLNNLNKSLRLSGLSAIIQLEISISSAKMSVISATYSVNELLHLRSEDNKPLLAAKKTEQECYIELWMNLLDRLAFCLLHGYVQEPGWRSEYLKYFKDSICLYKNTFSTPVPYNNIISIISKWERTDFAPSGQ